MSATANAPAPTGLCASGMVFRARTKPTASTAADGGFQVAVLVMSPAGTIAREAWRLMWSGPEAKAWWSEHGDGIEAGQPLYVEVDRIRAHSGSRDVPPEIHARVLRMELRAKRYAEPGATPTTHPAAQPVRAAA